MKRSMKPKTKQLFGMLDSLFEGKYDAYKFSCDFPDFCIDNYDELEQEYAGLGYYLDQEVPEICDEGEPGFDPTHMVAELKRVYKAAKEIYERAE